MKLLAASDWIDKYFDTPPDLRTVRGWVQRGEVPGRVIGKTTYVDDDAWKASVRTGNSLADGALAKLNS
ncbi:hypothetical protein [Nevskia sp.]|uniref:hypothetical protein n=1 Tax=Nevskia sp. TaxID=1929292 RepID=UPI0025F46928|nr:hypothetical protein [Nevskia sp.]